MHCKYVYGFLVISLLRGEIYWEMQRKVYFLPSRKKISLLGYIIILISLRLIVCKGICTMFAVQDTWTIYSLSETSNCENSCKTSALLYWKSLFTFQGKVPEEMGPKTWKKEAYSLYFLFCLKTKVRSKTCPESYIQKNSVIKWKVWWFRLKNNKIK